MIRQSDPKNARIVSVIAATVIALACGTNYAYSAWAPQFAQRLKLSSTQSNLIGTLGNLGMYASGIPVGIMVDSKGPHCGVALGALLLGAGYYPLMIAYDAGLDAPGVPVLCLFSFFTGSGSAAAFTAALKTSALNYPESRGTATAFPLAAFGLSAFFFSTIASFAMPDDTSKFLLLLATGTFILPVVCFFFLRILPPSAYYDRPQPERLRSTSSSGSRPRMGNESGAHREAFNPPSQVDSKDDQDGADIGDETSSLLSQSSSGPDFETNKHRGSDHDDSPHLDIRGFALLPHPEFWQLFSMIGLLTGIGLMTINNIGNDAQALWYHDSPSTSPGLIQQRQNTHVSILSFGSFSGRLLSGIGSDVIVSRLGGSRFWCVLASAALFAMAQILGTQVANPHLLVLVSGITGLAYGMLFGVYPSIVAHTFGVHGLSQNWGTMTLAPIVFGNIFNLLYGKIYDKNSVTGDDGNLQCLKGVACYSTAYWVTFSAALGGIALCVWSIWHENQVHRNKQKRRTDHERLA